MDVIYENPLVDSSLAYNESRISDSYMSNISLNESAEWGTNMLQNVPTMIQSNYPSDNIEPNLDQNQPISMSKKAEPNLVNK